MNEATLKSFGIELEKTAFKKALVKIFKGIVGKKGTRLQEKVVKPAKILTGATLLGGGVVAGGAGMAALSKKPRRNTETIRGRYTL